MQLVVINIVLRAFRENLRTTIIFVELRIIIRRVDTCFARNMFVLMINHDNRSNRVPPQLFPTTNYHASFERVNLLRPNFREQCCPSTTENNLSPHELPFRQTTSERYIHCDEIAGSK